MFIFSQKVIVCAPVCACACLYMCVCVCSFVCVCVCVNIQIFVVIIKKARHSNPHNHHAFIQNNTSSARSVTAKEATEDKGLNGSINSHNK